MSREYNPHINNESGATECAYAGCGKEVPADHYLCLRHYKKHQDGLAGPCPSEGCARFRSLDYERCADCGKAAAPESDPAWDQGDEGRGTFYAYLLLQNGGFYAGHSRDLRERFWEHRNGDCRSTSAEHAGDKARLVWFQECATRAEAADLEMRLKLMVLRDRRAVLAMVFRFQDAVRLVSPLL